MSNQDTNDTQATNALTAAEAKKRELVNFVANNILNGLTLNQTIQVVQQVALRDANAIVSEADEEKLQEIEGAYEQAKEQAAQAQAQEQAAAQPAPKKAASKKAPAKRGRKSTKKASA
jgi:hypothetical protein